MEVLALEALRKKCPQFGVKGPSMLSKLSHFDLVDGFVPDFLPLLGVARQLLSLWFDSNNHDSPWYIGQPSKHTMCESQLKNIVVQKEVRRLPRSISAREHWKGNEYKSFALYYSLIILQGILPTQYLNHYFLFVWSLRQLLGTSISPDDLNKVKAALDLFIVKMEELYGVAYCSFNVHQLSHLARSTQMCGPLWAVSTFVFESNNAILKNMIQGTQYIFGQVCQTYAIMKTLPVYVKQSVKDNDMVYEVLEKLVHGKSMTKKAVKLSQNVTALSKAKVRSISIDERQPLTEAAGGLVNHIVYEYSRFTLNGKLYESDKYQRSLKRKNCYIKAKHRGRTIHCKITALVTIKKCNCDIQHHEQCTCSTTNVLVCTLLNVSRDRMYRCTLLNIKSDFISEVTESPEIVTLDASDIISKCIKVCHNKKVYLVDMPNMIETE